MENHRVTVVRATPEAVAPYGYFIGAHGNVKKFASWPGTDVFGSFPITVGDGGEMLLVQMAPRIFPVVPSLIERHFKHSQTYLPFNGKPFIMLLGEPTDGDLPNYATLRAFLFDDSSGIILHANVWHDFPYALEPDTQFAVILREEAHVNVNTTPKHEFDADGPDLQRRGLKSRATITVELSDALRRK